MVPMVSGVKWFHCIYTALVTNIILVLQLLREFNKIVGRRMLLEDWEVWEKRILQYGKVKFGEKADEALQAKIEEAEDKDGKFQV